MTEPQCKICQHPARGEIEWGLDHGWAYRVLASRYGGFSVMSLSRHKSHRSQTVETAEAPPSTNGDNGVTPAGFASFAPSIQKAETGTVSCTRRHFDDPAPGGDINQDREHTVTLVLQLLGEHAARGGSMRVACEAALHRCWS
jgi:hypothetical protein